MLAERKEAGLWRSTSADRWYWWYCLRSVIWFFVLTILVSIGASLFKHFVNADLGEIVYDAAFSMSLLLWVIYLAAGVQQWWRRLDELEQRVELATMYWLGMGILMFIGVLWAFVRARDTPLEVSDVHLALFMLSIGVSYYPARCIVRWRLEH